MHRPILLLALLSACVDPDVGRDRDNDGFQTAELGGEDCDDTNAAVNPSASEACGNGIDDDCDGIIDDAGIGEITWYLDQDGDGFPSPEPHTGCTSPDGSFADLTRGQDCNDNEVRSFPGNPETYYDGIDGDCLGGDDFDADQDGYTSAEHGGDDCEDSALDVNPGSVEICNNGIDDDCDGGPGPCEYRGEYTLEDVAVSDVPHRTIDAGAADIDGDGELEFLLLDLPEDQFGVLRLRVYERQAVSGVLSLSTSRAVSDAGTALLSGLNLAGDFDGDGVVDPLVWTDASVTFWVGEALNERRADVGEDGASIAWVSVVERSEPGQADAIAVFANGDNLHPNSDSAAVTVDPWTVPLNLSTPMNWVPSWRVRGGVDLIPADGRSAAFLVSDPGQATSYASHIQWMWNLTVAFPTPVDADDDLLPTALDIFFRGEVRRGSDLDDYYLSGWSLLPVRRHDGVAGMRLDAAVNPPVYSTLPWLLEMADPPEDGPQPSFTSRRYCDVNLDGVVDVVQASGTSTSTLDFESTQVDVFYGSDSGFVERADPDASFFLPSATNEVGLHCGDTLTDSLWARVDDVTYVIPFRTP